MKTKLSAPYVPPSEQLGIKYPEQVDEHMELLPKIYDTVFDENYPYLDKAFKFKLWSGFIYFGIWTLVFLVSPIRFCLRIEGRNILRKHRKLFKNGAMTVANHVLRWDFLCVLQAIRYRRLYFPALASNINTADRGVIRAVGGIPVPTDIHAMKSFNEAFDELHQQKKWIHAFPEASSWDFYQPIRPFKKGVFTMAYRYNLPVIPLAFSYRPPTGIYKFFKKGTPLITLRIGEPLLPDTSLPRKEAVTILREQCHKRVIELAGIPEGTNPYPCEGD
jgi:1-acyl-sn-glycerol-3-phosphate acyltransferase